MTDPTPALALIADLRAKRETAQNTRTAWIAIKDDKTVSAFDAEVLRIACVAADLEYNTALRRAAPTLLSLAEAGISTQGDGTAARIAELEGALRPFAEASEELKADDPDRWDLWEHHAAMTLTLGDLRAARRALASGDEKPAEHKEAGK